MEMKIVCKQSTLKQEVYDKLIWELITMGYSKRSEVRNQTFEPNKLYVFENDLKRIEVTFSESDLN